MPAPAAPLRVLSAAAAAAVLLAGLTGCADKDGKAPAAASVAASPSGTVAESPSPSAPASASASPTAPASAAVSSAPPATPTARATTPPPAPTRLTVAVDTRGEALSLVRGGAAQEFTVTLRNGNSAAYGHLLVAFQMEILVGEPGDRPGSGPGFVLERFDPASGGWRAAALRIANDRMPESMYTGGAPLALETVRVERYRLRATAGGATGSTPLVVSFIDTDADHEVASHVVLPHSTR
ncbi:hypothetical protein ACGFYU_07165 [Streptomyces sp. NPDC048337]|uniref:hypothetical protein n=1 Tax=Streptomyces sp. NPDC048337 TaxID=3365535 RepID=UPI003719DDCF